MSEIRKEVREFMRSCEILFGNVAEGTGFTPDECAVLKFYAKELQEKLVPRCVNPQ